MLAVTGDAPAALPGEGRFELLEGRRRKLEDGVGRPHLFGTMGVGGAHDGVSAVSVVLGLAVRRELDGVEDLAGYEAELACAAEGGAVDVARDGEAAVAVDVIYGRADVHVGGAEEESVVHAEHVLVLVDDYLIAETPWVVIALLQPLVHLALHLAYVGQRREEREYVDLLRGGDLYAGDDRNPGLFPEPYGGAGVFGGVVVGDSDEVEAAPSGGLDDSPRRLAQVAAR